MKFSVVTACLNPGRLLRETVESVVGQQAVVKGRVGLEYIIVDGGSDDGTLPYLNSLSHPSISWISEPDGGLYDALAKGFERSSGDVRSYINAGDLYHSNAFDVVADTIGRTEGWLTGMAVTYNARGDFVVCYTPFPFRSAWFEHGMYDGRTLQFLQQESTFWTADLAERVDLSVLRTLRLAGDAYMWMSFARYAQITVVSAHLGGFRLHGSHLSTDIGLYREELRSFTLNPSIFQRVHAIYDRLLCYAPVALKRRLSRRLLVWRDGGWMWSDYRGWQESHAIPSAASDSAQWERGGKKLRR